jgi:hypothetical protein
MIRDVAYDVCELPLVNYLAAREQGAPFRALPAFLTRRFPQPMIVASKRSGIRAPEDLAGGRIGIGYYGNSDTAWVQVMLAEQFGVDCGSLTWVASQGPQVQRPVPPNVTQLPPATATTATDALPSPALAGMLSAGELDAVVYGTPRWDALGQHLAPLLDPAGQRQPCRAGPARPARGAPRPARRRAGPGRGLHLLPGARRRWLTCWP